MFTCWPLSNLHNHFKRKSSFGDYPFLLVRLTFSVKIRQNKIHNTNRTNRFEDLYQHFLDAQCIQFGHYYLSVPLMKKMKNIQ